MDDGEVAGVVAPEDDDGVAIPDAGVALQGVGDTPVRAHDERAGHWKVDPVTGVTDDVRVERRLTERPARSADERDDAAVAGGQYLVSLGRDRHRIVAGRSQRPGKRLE